MVPGLLGVLLRAEEDQGYACMHACTARKGGFAGRREAKPK
jgi:hypothetical protein